MHSGTDVGEVRDGNKLRIRAEGTVGMRGSRGVKVWVFLDEKGWGGYVDSR